MATNQTIGGNGSLFVGEDKDFFFEVIDVSGLTADQLDENGLPVDPTLGVPVNIAAMTLLFDVRKKDNSPDPSILPLTPSVVGVYSATRTANTQRAKVTVTDTQMNLFKAQDYRHSLKRMDDGSETVITRGNFSPEKATAP